MKKMGHKTLLWGLLVFTLPWAVFAGGKKEAPQEVTRILIGTSGSPAPYGWVNEDGTLDGYDSAVIQAVQEVLPQYQFIVEKTEFPSIFAGLDSGRYTIGVNNISWRKEREEKYLYAKNHYIYNDTGIVVRKGRTDIRGIEDLGGKTNVVSPGGAFPQLFAEEYNAAHPDNPIKITYSEEDGVKSFQDIEKGTLDFLVSERVIVESRRKEFGMDLDFISLPREEQEKIQNPKAYFIFPRTAAGEKIREAVDNAFLQLRASGKLKELSIKYFGYDISQ
ncbi:MAG: transporter substrate-binding domain-containing protein [Treponema sp.]|jgi:polar amino acid transport system substrate-binding protein|nr:transporter substrate-binding domain-containing protein [Treponema sp.]